MRRMLRYAVALVLIVAGGLFGALNSRQVVLDLYVWKPELSVGVITLAGVLFGCVLGAAALFVGRVMPLHAELRRTRRQLARPLSAEPQRGLDEQ